MLKMNLQFFAEEQEGNNAESSPAEAQNTGQQQGVENKTSAPAQKEQQQNNEHMIPKSRFDEVNSKFKSVQEQLDSLLAEKQQAEKQAKEEQGKFQELYEEASKNIDSYKSQAEQHSERVKALEGVFSELLDAKLEAVPEDLRDIIPDGLSPEQKLAWVDRAERKGLFGQRQSEQPLGESTNPAKQETQDASKLNPFQMLKSGYGRKK